jgi:hypothetical protein
VRAHELQPRHGKTLLGQALFDKLQFGFAQLGFEQVLIPINIPLMGAYARNLVHNRSLANKMSFPNGVFSKGRF